MSGVRNYFCEHGVMFDASERLSCRQVSCHKSEENMNVILQDSEKMSTLLSAQKSNWPIEYRLLIECLKFGVAYYYWNALCQIWLKLALNSNFFYFEYFSIISPWKEHGFSFEKYLNAIYPLCQVCLKLDQWLWKSFCNVVNKFLLFSYYLPLETWNLYQRMLCAKFCQIYRKRYFDFVNVGSLLCLLSPLGTCPSFK